MVAGHRHRLARRALIVTAITLITIGAGGLFQRVLPAAASTWRSLVFVANRGDTDASGTISVVDPSTRNVVTTIALPSGVHPRDLAITPDGATLYATTSGGPVIPIDTASDTVGTFITSSALKSTWGIAAAPDGKTVYAADGATSSLVPIDTATKMAGSPIPITGTTAGTCGYAGAVAGVAITDDGSAAFVTMPSWDIVARVDLTTRTVSNRASVRCPMGVTLPTDGPLVYVGSPLDNLVTAFGEPSLNLVTQGTVTYPYGMSSRWDGIYVPSNDTGRLNRLGFPNATGTSVALSGGNPRDVALSPDGVTAYVSDGGSNALSVLPAVLGSDQLVAVGNNPQGVAVTPEGLSGAVSASSAVEGQAFSGTVATVTDPNTARPLGDFGAQIDWGDGTATSSGTVSGSAGAFSVSGTHAYAEEGAYQVKVSAFFRLSLPTTFTGTISVADAPLTATAASGTTSPGTSFGGAVATFTDADPAGAASDYRATIFWGDGSTGPGTVAAGSSGFTVSGSHTYSSPPSGSIGVHICDAGACTEAGATVDHVGVNITASTTAGNYQPATAEAYDANGVALGDVTALAAFSITPDGSCGNGGSRAGPSVVVCGATIAGAHAVTATFGGKSGHASLQVNPGPLFSMALSALSGGPCNGQHGQQSCSVPAGTAVAYHAEGFDFYGNDIGDITATTTFAMTPDGSCSGASCTATLAGTHKVTSSNGTVSASLPLTVTALSLDHLGLVPNPASISAGGHQAYAATGYDKYGNNLGDVTAATTLSIVLTSNGAADGSCMAATCTATRAGDHTVTGNDGGHTGTALLTVTAGPADHLALTPASASITAGSAQVYDAAVADVYGNIVADVTSSTTFSFFGQGPAGSQPCTANSCAPTGAGAYTIVAFCGQYGGMQATATLTVVAATLDHIVLTPSSSTVTAGAPQTYAATGYDQYGNSLGDVTSATTFTIAKAADGTPDGSCSGAICIATNAVPHTATGTDSGIIATAALTVTPAALDHVALAPSSSTITAGASQTYAATGYDRYGNSLGDITGATTFSITRSSDGTTDGSCSAAICTASNAVPHTVTAKDGATIATASLTVMPAALDHLGLTPASASVTDGASQTYAATGYDQYGNSRGDVTASTTFGIGPDGSCTGSACTPRHAGSHTVTAAAGGKSGTAQLIVVAAPLMITASSATMTYADPVPSITPAYAGWVNNDGPASLSTAPTCSTTATSTSPAGSYPTTCSGAVDPDYAISYTHGAVVVSKRLVTLAYTGPLMVSTGSTSATTAGVNLQAQATQQNDGYLGDITKSAPVFLLYKSSNLSMTQPDLTCAATTTTSVGVATCWLGALATDNWTVVVQEPASNADYTGPDSQPVLLTVYTPSSAASTTGGGWIVDPSTGNMPVPVSSTNRHGNFGFTMRYKSGTTTPQGQAVYVFRGADGYDYIVKSNSWQGGGFAVTGNHASFSGKCTVTVINPTTGLAVTGLDGGGFSFRVDVTDNSATGAADSYALSVYDGSGTLYHQSGTPAGEIALGGGHIQVN